jgi:4-amino-4-deoxy-L-arabinose transferase-like glycosyltransferase
MRRSREGPAGNGARLAAVLLAAGSVPLLTLFLLRFPVPVRLPLAVATVRDLATSLLLLLLAVWSGSALLRLLRARHAVAEGGERLLAAAGLGYGAIALGARGLAALDGLRPLPLAAAGALALVLTRREWGVLATDLASLRRSVSRAGALGGARAVLAVLLGVALALMLLEALAPPTAYDALRYHLRLPRIYADQGGWVDVPFDFNSAFPQNVNMIFAVAFALGAPRAASLTHLILGVLATGAVAMLARRAGGQDAGLPAAAIYFTMPVVAFNSAWAYIDQGVVLFTLLSIWSAARFRAGGEARAAGLAGIFAGLALGSKYTAAASLPVLGAWILLAPRRSAGPGRRRALGAAALFLALTLAVSSPWWLRNWFVRGNPVYPFASAWFGAPAHDTYRAALHQLDLERPEIPATSPGDWLALPWRFTMAPWVRDEMIGPALLVSLPILVLSAGAGSVGLLGLAGAFAVVWIATSPQARLFLHGLGLLGAAAGAAWGSLLARRGGPARLGGALLCIAIAAAVLNLAVAQRALSDPFQVVAGMESEEAYLTRMVEGHAAIAFINRALPADARILFVGEIFGYHCRRPYLLGSKFDTPPIVAYISEAPDLDAFRRRLEAEGFTHVLYSQAQLRRFASLPQRYLAWPDERSRGIYREFMTRWLEPIHADDDAVVSRILAAPRELTPAPQLDTQGDATLSSRPESP